MKMFCIPNAARRVLCVVRCRGDWQSARGKSAFYLNGREQDARHYSQIERLFRDTSKDCTVTVHYFSSCLILHVKLGTVYC